MDSRLHQRLMKIENQISVLADAERTFLTLEANREALKAQLFMRADGNTIAEREAKAVTSKEWQDFMKGYIESEVIRNTERRRYEMKLKAFDAEYTTYKIENSAIQKQGMSV